MRALPSVNLIASMPGRNSIVMRGISTGSAEYRTDSQVAVYLDDQPMTSISTQVEVRLIDLARIEALPGPQGTLFGSSSQSGTIRYITNKPDTTKFTSQLDAELGTTKGGEESYDVSGHVNIPVTDNIAIRAVGFYSLEGGYVDNVLGPTLVGDRDNADVVEKNWNDYQTWGGRIAGRWQISPEWESTLSLITQYSEADGAWESDPALGDYKITRFFDEFRDDNWYQASLNAKGDLGFAELSVTASYFDRSIKYEWDDANYSQWRSAYYGGFDPDYGTGSYNIYNTGVELSTTFNDQKQKRSAYEVRLTSQGESRFAVDGRRLLRGREGLVALRRQAAEPDGDDGLGRGQLLRLLRERPGLRHRLPARADRHLLLGQVPQDDQADGRVRRGDLRPDRQVVDHGRRALVRVRPQPDRDLQHPARPAGLERFRGRRGQRERGQGVGHGLQVRHGIPVSTTTG